MTMGKFVIISGSIFFIFMLLFSYLFIYSTVTEAIKSAVISTLIFIPFNFLLNKLFNAKRFEKN